MAERTINGKIAKWGEMKLGEKKSGEMWYKISLTLQGQTKEWHTFFLTSPEEGKNLRDKAPTGSTIEFKQWKPEGSEYWNFRKGTFKVIAKGTEEDPKGAQGNTFTGGSSNAERDPGMNARTALMQAREMVCYNKIPAEKLQETAEMYKLWLDTGNWTPKSNIPPVGTTDKDWDDGACEGDDNDNTAEEGNLM